MQGRLPDAAAEGDPVRAAIAAGYDYAAERGYAYCGRVDADGQHPVAELRRLLDLVRKDVCDVAVGSRFAPGEGYDADRYEPTPARRLGTGLLRSSMSMVLGKPFHDANTKPGVLPVKAFSGSAARWNV